MKKTVGFLLIFVMVLSAVAFPVAAQQANEDITIMVDGKSLITDALPYIDADAGRVMVPLRAIFENFGAELNWEPDTQTVTITSAGVMDAGTHIVIIINQNEARVNGDTVYLDCPAVIKDDRTMVPLRFIVENLGAAVEWFGETRTVTITSKTTEIPAPSPLVSEEPAPSLAATPSPPPSVLPTIKPIEGPLNPENFKLTNTMKRKAVENNVYIFNKLADGRSYATGSGVVISEDGLIVTNYHVIEGAENITAQLSNDRVYEKLTVVGYDKYLDIAILKAPVVKLDFHAEPDYEYDHAPGRYVYAASNPKGELDVVALGEINGKYHMNSHDNIDFHMNLLTYGSSGGGVYNTDQKLVGIVCAGRDLADGETLGIYIPIQFLPEVLEQKKSLSIKEFAEETKAPLAENALYELKEKYKTIKLGKGKGSIRIGNMIWTARSAPSNYRAEYLEVVVNINYADYELLDKARPEAEESIETMITEVYEYIHGKVSDKGVLVFFVVRDTMAAKPVLFENDKNVRYDAKIGQYILNVPICSRGNFYHNQQTAFYWFQ